MIRYNPKDWFGLIFKFHKSDTFRKLGWVMLSVAVYSGIMAYVLIEVLQLGFKSTAAMHSILGFVISILLVFRTNTAYDRWWEGRRMWGSLVNTSRSLTIKLNAIAGASGVRVNKEIIELIGFYPEVLKDHLRGHKTKRDGLPQDVHQPNYMLNKLVGLLHEDKAQGSLSQTQLLFVNDELRVYSDICGSCERIRNTPIPFSYSLFLKKFIFVYVITMPYGFIGEFGYGIIAAVTFVFYVLASLELIAEEIENPFGTDANDLGLDEIADVIRINVMELAGYKDVQLPAGQVQT